MSYREKYVTRIEGINKPSQNKQTTQQTQQTTISRVVPSISNTVVLESDKTRVNKFFFALFAVGLVSDLVLLLLLLEKKRGLWDCLAGESGTATTPLIRTPTETLELLGLLGMKLVLGELNPAFGVGLLLLLLLAPPPSEAGIPRFEDDDEGEALGFTCAFSFSVGTSLIFVIHGRYAPFECTLFGSFGPLRTINGPWEVVDVVVVVDFPTSLVEEENLDGEKLLPPTPPPPL
jgi:hypothetical protein